MVESAFIHAAISKTFAEQLRTYDDCFAEFLDAARNGQKHLQAILLREAFERFRDGAVGIQSNTPTVVLDVSCGPGGYSTAWTSQVAQFLPHGIEFHCTDFKGGRCRDGMPYPTATAEAIKAASARGNLRLAGEPSGVEADLFLGTDAIIIAGRNAHIVHWSHSGYHVLDALGDQKSDAAAIAHGLNTAVDKMWAALDGSGLMFSVHQTGDVGDGIPSDLASVSKRYLGFLDDIPARITGRITENGGHVASLHFAAPLQFPLMGDGKWDALKDPARWESLDGDQTRALRLLSFIAHDFSDSQISGPERLAEIDRLGAFVDEYKGIVRRNGGHIYVKCAFQMGGKSEEVGRKLADIAAELEANMPRYLVEMRREMAKASGQG